MGQTIAIAGKGGVGKTTVSGLIIEALRRKTGGPILAIDADPNATLADVLGLKVDITLGEMQATTLATIRDLPSGVPLGRHIEYELHRAMVEGDGVDLITMGRGEGPGCYCAVNSILRRCLETLSRSYPYTVLDNEAGLEHLSRRVSQGVDALIIVSDGNPVALRAAVRINQLVDELGLGLSKRGLVLNDLRGELSSKAQALLAETGLPVLASLPHDDAIEALNLDDRPLSELPDTHPSLHAVDGLLTALLAPHEETAT
ncbi:AAA family ATPase [Candidatus Bipolaricaulota bacterium]|nr:AAA family ATPase [Candidatus Bipolaricaulota bacterium]